MGLYIEALMNKNKIANNILELLFDPTVIPVEKRLYFRKEENLQNESYEGALADAFKSYRDQRHNSDFYSRKQSNEREVASMDRKTLIASFDILSQVFNEGDPISTDLKQMAETVAKMKDEDLEKRIKVESKAKTFECPKCGTKVLEQTGYCVKCKAKVKKASEEDPWTKEASEVVRMGLVADVVGKEALEKIAGKKKGPGIPDGTGPMSGTPMCKIEPEAPVAIKAQEEKILEEGALPLPPPPPVAEPDKGIQIIINKAAQEAPAEEAPKTPKTPKEEKVEEKKAEDIKPAKVVDTSLLDIDGIEMHAGMILPEELEPMSPEEEMKLNQLFN